MIFKMKNYILHPLRWVGVLQNPKNFKKNIDVLLVA